jgi:hypothetical protein
MVEDKRRQWLETVAAACEAVLADIVPRAETEPYYAALAEEARRLLAKTTAELGARGVGPNPTAERRSSDATAPGAHDRPQ